MSNWRTRRRRRLSQPLRYRLPTSLVQRTEAVPIGSIDVLLRAVADVMNAIPTTDNYDHVLATRLYYTVMCLRRFFSEWGVHMRPCYFGDHSQIDQRDLGFSENSDIEPLVTDV